MAATGPNKIIDMLGGFTSDHGWQTIEVTDEGPPGTRGITLKGLTWNMLNKGHEKGAGAYSNNPFDIQEDPNHYVERKQKQFNQLIAVIKDRAAKGEPLDFMLLQEVNAFTNGELNGYPAIPPKPAVPGIPGLKAVVDKFKNDLQALGWNLEMTHPKTKCKPMVTLYNTATLTRFGDPEGAIMGPDGKNTAFTLGFVHSAAQRLVAVTNLHLAYGEDNSNAILQYQFDQIEKGIFTVMGGDTNHPPNFELEGQIGNFNYATNIDADPATLGAVTDIDSRTTGAFKKHYDGFFVSPGGKQHSVMAKESVGVCFEIQGGKAKVRLYDPKNEYQPGMDVHSSIAPGVPWIRKKSAAKLIPFLNDRETKAIVQKYIAQSTAAKAPAVQAAVVQQVAAPVAQAPVVNPPVVQPQYRAYIPRIPNPPLPQVATPAITNQILIYSALTPQAGQYRVGIKFESKQARDVFFWDFAAKARSLGIDPTKFVAPSRDSAKQDMIYIHSSQGPGTQGAYLSKNQELSINFGNTELRDYFNHLVGIKPKHAHAPKSGSAILFDPKKLPPTPDRRRNIAITVKPAIQRKIKR